MTTTTTAQHTPWKAVRYHNKETGRNEHIVIDDNGHFVAQVTLPDESEGIYDPEIARLIAAAPELYEELRTSAGNFETVAAYLEQLRAAGVTFPASANTPSIDAMIDGLRIRAEQARAAIGKAEGRQ